MPRELKTINIEVGQRIRERRKELRLTREELSSLAGYSSNFIQEVERGRSGLSSESLLEFSKALDVSADYLIRGEIDHSFDYLLLKLSAVPPNKIPLIQKLIDDAILCCQDK